MSVMQIVSRHRIHEGHFEGFKRIAETAMAVAQNQEPDTVQYDWFFDEKESECVVIHTYRDSNALMHHIRLATGALSELRNITETTIEAFGPATPELKEMLDRFGVKLYKPYMKLER